MDEHALGALTVVLMIGGGLVGVGVVGGGIAYAADVDLAATVTAKNCLGSPTVDVKTKFLGLETSVEVDPTQCAIIQVNNFVEYHIRSERTIIYASEGGECIWDTETGPCQ